MQDYRNSKQISQSDLIIAKGLLTSGIKEIPLKAAMFGKALHEAILEPEKFNLLNYPILQDTRSLKCLQRTTQALLQDKLLADLLHHGLKEHVVYWKEPNSRIDCKARIDLLNVYLRAGTWVTDIKTTSETYQLRFEKKLTEYNYDIQGAFYVDSVQADNLLFIACCKTNGKVFHCEFPADSTFIKEGRRKYRFILQKVLQNNLFERIYAVRQQNALREQQLLQQCKVQQQSA